MNTIKKYLVLFFLLCTYQLQALKLDRVILATDANPNYIEFWPIVAKAWQEIIGVRPTLALIASADVEIDESLGDIIRFEPIEGIPTSFYAQCIRLFIPFLFPDQGCIISDIDMIPLNRNYFIKRAASINDECFITYRDNAAFEKTFKQIPMCYVAGKGRTFSEIFQIYSKNDLIEKIKEWYALGIGWFTDQELLYKSLLAWSGYPKHCVRLGNIDSINQKTRIDKFNWNYDINLLKQQYYIDCHSQRPYSKYKKFVDKIVECLQETYTIEKEKYVLGSRLAGLFSNIFGVINHLIWAEKENKDLVIYWSDKKSLYGIPYGYNGSKNIWHYYFDPISESFYCKNDIIHYDYFSPDGHGIAIDYKEYSKNFSYEFRTFIQSYIDNYIKIKPSISKKIDDFYQTTMEGRKTIGIHVRRTDHIKETPPIKLKRYIEVANSFKDVQFFIATDDERVLDILKKYLNGPVVYYDSFRSVDGSALHKFNNCVTNRALMGEQILIETKLLSMCDVFIHSISNVSLAALFFNPALKNIYLDPYQE